MAAATSAAPPRNLASYTNWILVIAGMVLLAIVPPLIGGYVLRAMATYLIFGLLALAVGLITGYGRLFNLGVGANFGMAGYTIAILAQYGVTNPFVLLAAAMVVGVLMGLLFAFYSVVAAGTEYLMLTFLTTLAFATIPLAIPQITGGENGLQLKGGLEVSFGLNPLEGPAFYWFVLGWVLAVALLSWYILHSQTGKAVQAIGRNPTRAAAMGYSVVSYRVALTIYAGLVASIGGWLYTLQNSFVYGDLLGLANSTNGLVYALIGGADTILGPFLGTALLQFVTQSLSRGSTQSSLYIGIMLMVVVYVIPDGIMGLAARLRLFASSRRRGSNSLTTETPGAL